MALFRRPARLTIRDISPFLSGQRGWAMALNGFVWVRFHLLHRCRFAMIVAPKCAEMRRWVRFRDSHRCPSVLVVAPNVPECAGGFDFAIRVSTGEWRLR